MATVEIKQTWVPYQPTKDCSMGFCSIYCHHWCYLIFPPPPPVVLSPDTGSRLTFSPLAIAIIGVLVAAFLLVGYFAIISKNRGGFEALRRRLRADDRGGELDDNLGEAWRVSPRHGLEQTTIDKIALRKYRSDDGLVEGKDCSICLGEFREDETLRLLPKCSHAFHLQCIDAWLKSHSNCPLCRAIIVVAANPDPPVLLLQSPAPQVGEENQTGGSVEAIPRTHADMESHAIAEIRDYDFQRLRRSSSMGSLRRGRDSMMEVSSEEFVDARDNGGEQVEEGSSRNRSLRMKRSFSSGRFGFSRNGRGRSAILPI
ncbi:hypothetical protein Cni_G04828 [Canna indica]|uniref:RING-type E3 ubiquitin transferase n=1 Tax=Canna indica TaxID=4628 RepID=A0AAQ3JU69_9LILI|nr:hypothetical protein Cni_G04828 [Canna indica]